MTLAIVQHKSRVGSGSQVPGSLTLNSAPTVGNLLVAFVSTNVTFSTLVLSGSWTLFAAATPGDTANTSMLGVYRYVQSGDTAVLPAFCSSGATFWAASVYEVSGVSGAWETDAQSVTARYFSGSGNAAMHGSFTGSDNCLALIAGSQYNSTVGLTVPSGWTSDETGVNNANYGAWAAASQAIASKGTLITGSFTGGAAGIGGVILLILKPGASAIPVVRQSGMQAVNGVPGSLTLRQAPVVGNLLLAFLGWERGNSVTTFTLASGWTEVARVLNGSNLHGLLAYRYVQPGDTAALPSFGASGSLNHFLTVAEISAVSGSWGNDFINQIMGRQGGSLTSITTTSDTAPNGSLALVFCDNYNGATLSGVAVSSGWVLEEMKLHSAAYGSALVAIQPFVTGGSVSATISGLSSGSTSGTAYAQVIIGVAAGPGPGPGALAPFFLVIT